MALTILADEKVPYLREAFGALGTLVPVAASEISHGIHRADALIVRSVTRVDEALLRGTPVRWVGSATAGLDHVDETALARRGIVVEHTPGANAPAVVEYVVAAVSRTIARGVVPGVAAQPWWIPEGPQWGVVGFGHIGRRLTRLLRTFGCRVRVCDPLLAQRVQGDAGGASAWHRMAAEERYVELNELLASSDIVTLHVPLTEEGPHPTLHLLDLARVRACRPGALLVNTSRGAVVSSEAVAADSGLFWILDVWEHEPAVDPSLLVADQVVVATPHVAGYTHEAKVAATHRLHQAFCRFLNLTPTWHGPPGLAPPPMLSAPSSETDPMVLARLLDQAVGITTMDIALRALADATAAERARGFERLRSSHRRELRAHRLELEAPLPRSVRCMLTALGMP